RSRRKRRRRFATSRSGTNGQRERASNAAVPRRVNPGLPRRIDSFVLTWQARAPNRRRSSQRSGVARHHRFPNASTAIALLASAGYINALDNPFVYDDTFTVTRNPSIVDPTNIRFLLAYTPFRPIVN